MTTHALARSSLSPRHAAPPAVVTLQHALLWLMGFGGAIVFIEPSPYEIAILTAMVVFFAPGLRMRLVFVPLLLLLFLVNLGYTICAAYLLDKTADRELDPDVLVHGDHGDLLRAGDVRGHRGAARHCCAAA